ncbi:OmpA family protein [Vibrio tapetis]|uniref:OmpA-like domain-containing protein n=1 Tax=Vibrio tapetis subsp. tapetis TaxID=1671868 RepID=A0A2N8Z8A0_9VIBR|nr:OmpA family protein [Vibrio tapetis]SON48148.1 protein of unknown function [Vibrio tapetis subsp. tapetis]
MIRLVVFAIIILITSGCVTVPKKAKVVESYRIGDCQLPVGTSVVRHCGKKAYMSYRKKALELAANELGYEVSFSPFSYQVDKTDPQSLEFKKLVEQQAKEFGFPDDALTLGNIVTISSQDELFESSESDMSARKRVKLDKMLKAYLDSLDTYSNIIVVGHTDAVGTKKDNLALSQERAKYIGARLLHLSEEKVPVSVFGAGEKQPIAPNSNASGRNKNRRIEIVDVFNITPSAKMEPRQFRVIAFLKNKQTKVDSSHFATTAPPPKKSKSRTAAAKKKPKVIYRDDNPLKLRGERYAVAKNTDQLMANLGTYHDDSWWLIRSARASSPVRSCVMTPPPKYSESTNNHTSVYESLPALFKTTWFGKANKGKKQTLVVVGPIQIDSDDYESTIDPTLSILLEYQDPSQQPDYTFDMKVQTVRGEDTVLYRMYPKEKQDHLVCADLIFHNSGENKTKYAEVFYRSHGHLYRKQLQLSLTL